MMQWLDVKDYKPAESGYYFTYSEEDGIGTTRWNNSSNDWCMDSVSIKYFAIPDPIPKSKI